MKLPSAILLLLTLAQRLPAQLPSGSTAPDFTAQDIKGQSWHLYDLLEQGKTVVLEIGATWCHPCWAYHNSQALQQLYAAHGPDGDDNLQVFFIEADPNTNSECLSGQQGCNNLTLGDWVSNTNFPVLDNAAIADSFQVEYFPTILIICPNKKVYQAGQLNAEAIWEMASGCPVAFGANNAGIFDYHVGTELREVCETIQTVPSFSLVNLGSNPLTNATITLQWNNDLEQTKYWQGNLPTYGEATFTFDTFALKGPGTLKTTVVSVNNNPSDDDYSNNVRFDHFIVAEQFKTIQVLLKLKTDDYGAETYWELRNENDSVLYWGGNSKVGPNGGGMFGITTPGPGAYGNNVLVTKTLTLPGDGCYSILFVDAYGDGMCCNYGNGYYKLYNSSNPVIPILSGGEFGATEHRGFKLAVTSSVAFFDVETSGLRLFPNPASDRLNIELTLAAPAIVTTTVYNSMGQIQWLSTQHTLPSGEHLWLLPINGWPSGTYFLRAQVGEKTEMHKFFVAE